MKSRYSDIVGEWRSVIVIDKYKIDHRGCNNQYPDSTVSHDILRTFRTALSVDSHRLRLRNLLLNERSAAEIAEQGSVLSPI